MRIQQQPIARLLRFELRADRCELRLERHAPREQDLREPALAELIGAPALRGEARRPFAATHVMEHGIRPEKIVTVFAGQDRDATEQARTYFAGYQPSSPSIALLRDGKLVFMMERHDIEHREAEDIAGDLTSAFDKYCANTSRN